MMSRLIARRQMIQNSSHSARSYSLRGCLEASEDSCQYLSIHHAFPYETFQVPGKNSMNSTSSHLMSSWEPVSLKSPPSPTSKEPSLFIRYAFSTKRSWG